METKYVIININ